MDMPQVTREDSGDIATVTMGHTTLQSANNVQARMHGAEAYTCAPASKPTIGLMQATTKRPAHPNRYSCLLQFWQGILGYCEAKFRWLAQ